MSLPDLDDLHRRNAHMEAARRMGSQDGLREPSPVVRGIEDRLAAGEITTRQALAAIRSEGVSTSASDVARGLSDVRIFELRMQPVAGRFDLAHFQQIHARLVGGFEGQPADRHGSPALRIDPIDARAHRLFAELAREDYLRGLDGRAFTERAAQLGADLLAQDPANMIHGRTTRLFLEQLGAQAGHPLDFSRLSGRDLHAHLDASPQLGSAALQPLIVRALRTGQATAQQLGGGAREGGFLELAPQAGRVLSPAAAAYLRTPEQQAVAQHPELTAAFAAERHMRAAAVELGALAPEVERGVGIRIRQHLAVLVHCEVDVHASAGVLNAVRHDAATSQLDHVLRRTQEAGRQGVLDQQASSPGQDISMAQRVWLIRWAEDALQARPSVTPSAAIANARHAEARWIAGAVGVVEAPTGQPVFQHPALQAQYEVQQRERAAGIDREAAPLQALHLETHRDF